MSLDTKTVRKLKARIRELETEVDGYKNLYLNSEDRATSLAHTVANSSDVYKKLANQFDELIYFLQETHRKLDAEVLRKADEAVADLDRATKLATK